jgi:glycerol uptake operon antiterminator
MYPINDIVEHQTIAAVQRENDLEAAIQSKVNVIFLLMGSVLNLQEMSERVKRAGKHVFIYMDFFEGFTSDKSGVDYVARHIRPTGIISARSSLITAAKEMRLLAIQRLFLIDHDAVLRGVELVEQNQPDAIEVMPGIMPRIIAEITNLTMLPIIAGGLVGSQNEIDEGLKAGALAVSVTAADLW